MPAFISKLQYKTCEDGEYYEEQVRTLEETLALINTFPWERERFAEIDLTGPSVTITDGNGNYLKVGIHYGGNFHMYYLDRRNRFYERYPIHIDDVEEMVIDFFNGQVKLRQFGKDSWGYFKRRYFLTKSFKYTIKAWSAILIMNTFVLAPLPCFVLGLFSWTHDFTNLVGLYICIGALMPAAFGAFLFLKYHQHLKRHITISRGNNVFIFGEDEDENTTYNKADIIKIIHYKPTNRRANDTEYFDLIFKDNFTIRLSNVLIGDLESKFSGRWKMEREQVSRNTWLMYDSVINEIDGYA